MTIIKKTALSLSCDWIFYHYFLLLMTILSVIDGRKCLPVRKCLSLIITIIII